MSKLFIFGIGGTGSRVLRAFTHLCAAGLNLENTSQVIPIIIDPDSDNKDMERTVSLINNYRKINKKLDFGTQDKPTYFKTIFQSLGEYHNLRSGDSRMKEDVVLSFDILSNETFQDTLKLPFIESTLTKQFLELIYTKENLGKQLSHGYLGNPNIGSMLLHKLKLSPEFNYFAANFVEGDRIFIISSIFGGTGAAGFPVLLKTLRDPSSTLTAGASMNRAEIGAITILPYFKVQQDNSSNIDSNNFITKTKAALAYYTHNLDEINAMYYLGDKTIPAMYDNNDGGRGQMNNANLIELIAALSIFHFTSNDNLGTTKYFEYELGDSPMGETYNLRNLNSNMDEELSQRLTSLFFMRYFLRRDRSLFSNDSWYKVPNLNDNFFKKRDYEAVEIVLEDFELWLTEMGENQRQFKPFNMKKGVVNPKEMYDIVVGHELQKKILGNFKVDDLSKSMNTHFKPGATANLLDHFLKAFDKSTNDCINKFKVLN